MTLEKQLETKRNNATLSGSEKLTSKNSLIAKKLAVKLSKGRKVCSDLAKKDAKLAAKTAKASKDLAEKNAKKVAQSIATAYNLAARNAASLAARLAGKNSWN
jgi:hypothetical protein